MIIDLSGKAALVTGSTAGIGYTLAKNATKNSGASGYVADEQKPGSATHAPGEPNRADNSTATAPSAQNSGAGISGAPGDKNGPAANKGTVGSANENNLSVQEQDPANGKGMPGNKSGPPAKR